MAGVRIERAVIVHGYLGHSGKHWFPALASDLAGLGVRTDVVDLPTPDEPGLERWVEHLARTVGTPDEELLLVTHSLGGLATAAYLGGLTQPYSLGAFLAVAPFYDPLPAIPELDDFISGVRSPEGILESIGRNTLHRSVIRSDGDPYVPLEHSERYAAFLGAPVVVDGPAEHFFDSAYPSITSTATAFVEHAGSAAARP